MEIHEFCAPAFVAIFLQIFSFAQGSHFRIVGGRKASTLEFPYQIDLERLTLHWCGGSIIHKRYVLTAAHCVKAYEALKPVPPYIMRVRAANDKTETGGHIYHIKEIIAHENYTDHSDTDQFDIALLKMEKPFKFNDRVKLVKLAINTPIHGIKGWVSGFGRQELMRSMTRGKRHLMAVELPVISLKTCRKILPNVAKDMICAGLKKGQKDSCTGDSGGPYVVNNELVGIVAWGVGCGREGLPGVYTNIAYYRDWINSHLKDESEEDENQEEENESEGDKN